MSLAKRNSEAAKAWAAKRRASQERALLHQGSSPSSRRSVGREGHPPPKHAASTSHEANAAYMDHFRASMADMYMALEAPSGRCDGIPSNAEDRAHLAAASAPTPSHTARARQRGSGGKSVMDRHRLPSQGSERRRRLTENEPGANLLTVQLGKGAGGGGAVGGWYTGPLDPAGKLVDLSDRNLLCASVLGDEAVFGCADHALYCVDLSREVKTRQLYGSRSKPDAGHKEWVSVVSHTAHGDIVSGGVDGKLCLWPRSGGDPGEIQAHAGSISAMKVDMGGRVVTSGYGGALRVWDCRGSGDGRARAPRLAAELSDQSLPSPCMDLAWCGSRVMTGHRDGRVGVYDLETGAMVVGSNRSRAHHGHVTTVNVLGDEGSEGCTGCFVTGGQDGFVRIWDPRVGDLGGRGSGPTAVMEAPAHRSAAGVGAVGGVTAAGSGGNRMASFGADKRVCILEVRGGRGVVFGASSARSRREFEPSSSSLAIEHVFDKHRDFIYCMDVVPASSRGASAGGGEGGIIVTGGGDGMLLVHDLMSMRLLYGLGCCSAGAVRCVFAGEGRLAVGGDDGNAMLYSFGNGDVGDEARHWGGK